MLPDETVNIRMTQQSQTHKYMQSYVSSVMLGFQLPPIPPIPPIVSPQQGPVPGEPNDQEHDSDDGGSTDLIRRQVGCVCVCVCFFFFNIVIIC